MAFALYRRIDDGPHHVFPHGIYLGRSPAHCRSLYFCCPRRADIYGHVLGVLASSLGGDHHYSLLYALSHRTHPDSAALSSGAEAGAGLSACASIHSATLSIASDCPSILHGSDIAQDTVMEIMADLAHSRPRLCPYTRSCRMALRQLSYDEYRQRPLLRRRLS